MAESSKSKKAGNKKSKAGRGPEPEAESSPGRDATALLSKAKVPAAATGAVLIGVAGAATIKKSKNPRTRKGKLLKRAAKTSHPTLSVAAGGARRLKKLVPGV